MMLGGTQHVSATKLCSLIPKCFFCEKCNKHVIKVTPM